MLTVGVLALQGAVQEHLDCLNALPDTRGLAVKKAAELTAVDALILPGGESTAIGKLLREFELTSLLTDRIRSGLPVWGTCAGMILLAGTIVDEPVSHLGVMDIAVRRNAYGSQLDSFRTDQVVPAIAAEPLPLVFIRAPYVVAAGPKVNVLAVVDDKIVAVEENNMLATAFHPELSGSLKFHSYFAAKAKGHAVR